MKLLVLFLILSVLVIPASALELTAPEAPASARSWMPENTGSFAQGLSELAAKALNSIVPELREAARVSTGIVCTALLVSLVSTASEPVRKAAGLAGAVSVGVLLLSNADSMVSLAVDTLRELGDYGKLLLGVMTAALAAQGGITASAALYTGTAVFLALLQSAINHILVPGIWLLITLGIGRQVTREPMLKGLSDMLKGCLVWCLKLFLMVFTTYLSLTGVVSGTADVAAMKAAKVGMSTFVPVVGGVLADASEAVLVSAALMKNAAGIYGIFAVLAIFLQPFLRIGALYLMLKLTGAACAAFAPEPVTGTLEVFSSAMGLLLGMTAAGCTMVLISTVCFMKGAM